MGGMTELEEAQLTEGQGRALRQHLFRMTGDSIQNEKSKNDISA
jgi:hypothetical protein